MSKLKTYTIIVKEVSSKEIKIEAYNKHEALNKVKSLYTNQDIVLDYDNFKDVTFHYKQK